MPLSVISDLSITPFILCPNLENNYNLLFVCLISSLPVSSVDSLCKQFGPISGSKLFDTQMVFLKEFVVKVILKKINRQQKTRKEGKELIIPQRAQSQMRKTAFFEVFLSFRRRLGFSVSSKP